MVSVKVVERVPHGRADRTAGRERVLAETEFREQHPIPFLAGRLKQRALTGGEEEVRPCAARRCKPGVEDAAFDYWQVRDRLAPIQLVGTIGEVKHQSAPPSPHLRRSPSRPVAALRALSPGGDVRPFTVRVLRYWYENRFPERDIERSVHARWGPL